MDLWARPELVEWGPERFFSVFPVAKYTYPIFARTAKKERIMPVLHPLPSGTDTRIDKPALNTYTKAYSYKAVSMRASRSGMNNEDL